MFKVGGEGAMSYGQFIRFRLLDAEGVGTLYDDCAQLRYRGRRDMESAGFRPAR
jgi:hypothetical protein